MIKNTIGLFVLAFGVVAMAPAQITMYFKSVTIYVVRPDREGPVALDRMQVLEQWDKKIELGLSPATRFSHLFGLLLRSSTGAEIREDAVRVPHIVVVALSERGERFEFDLSLNTGIMTSKGRALKDGEVYREMVRYIFEMAGERPSSGSRREPRGPEEP